MKKIIYIITVALFANFNVSTLPAQSSQGPSAVQSVRKRATITHLHVLGNCESCKARIEKAAKSAGATTALWNVKTKDLTLNFDSSKTDLDKIAKSIALAGHDNAKFKAEDKTYNALPSCCKYERKK